MPAASICSLDNKLVEDVRAATPGGEGTTAVIVCTAFNAAYAQGLSFLENDGTLVYLVVPRAN